MNRKSTSNNVAALASKVLNDNSSSATAKQLAGSALSQVNKGNQTSGKMENVAAKVLDSPKYNATTKTLAGTVLSQSVKGR